MEKITLNDELYLPVPEGFHTLTEEERGKMKMLQDGPWEGISDPERHILVTAGCSTEGIKSRTIA